MKAKHLVISTALVLQQLQMSAVPALAEPAQPGAPAVECDISQFKPPANTTITLVRTFTSPVSYCRVDGFVTTNDPTPNTVNFQISLPDKWNGRYLMYNPGGGAGFVADPDNNRLTMGYADASTDKGSHAPNALNMRFQKYEARHIDFMGRGLHVTSVATQEIARAYYARQKIYRYITGCSGGGVGTLNAAENYPEDADGFIPGAYIATPFNTSFFGYIAQYIYRDPARWLSGDDLKRAGEVIMKEYDDLDGAHDGLIWDPSRIKLRREMFPFLTAAQYSTLEVMQRGLPAPPGMPKQNGFWLQIGNPGFWVGNPAGFGIPFFGTTPPPWNEKTQPRMFAVPDSWTKGLYGQQYSLLRDMDYTSPQEMLKERDMWSRTSGELDPKNLAKIRKLGGKIVVYFGSAENAVSPMHGINYQNEATRLYGPSRQDFLRTFYAPGMYHCAGGEGQPTDVPAVALDAAVAWVEQGQAPDAIVAHNPQISRSYLLCPYPRHSKFKGGITGMDKQEANNVDGPLDVNDARNWTCVD